MASPHLVRIGVDTGGTFTDVVVAGPRRLWAFKVPSTPDDPSRAIVAGLERALAEEGSGRVDLAHGTTVGTNALLERRGARTAFVATAGFEDLLVIGRQARPELYNLGAARPEPLVEDGRRFGLDERVAPGGAVLVTPSPEAIDELADAVARSGAESVAVCLLFSFANPEHERAVEAALVARGLPVSCSHRILPEFREYERAATVAVNAYLVPRMARYLDRLAVDTAARGVASLRVMQSSGGAISAATAAREPVRTILSGPAGGAVAAGYLAREAGLGDLVTFDMGGTSTDVALVAGGHARVTSETRIAGLPVAVPVIDIHTVGAGGGSVAVVDAGGALRVGPESAGADPGPACYGRGEAPTVTDANVVLGRLSGGLLGGQMPLDLERARRALDPVARKIGALAGREVSVEEAALGVVRVVSANMERALRAVSIERGYDPRAASLLSFGGAGGLHACALAAALRMRRVIVPPLPGAFSALGLLLGDVVRDFSRTVVRAFGDPVAVEALFEELEAEGREALREEGISEDRTRLMRSAALRYRGQSFEIDVEWGTDAVARFHEAHRVRYGHADEARPVELVHVRVRAVGETDRPELPRLDGAGAGVGEASGTTEVVFAGDDGAPVVERIAVYAREALGAGAAAAGPALVTEYGSTTLVPHGWSFSVDAWGSLAIGVDGPA